MVCTSSSPAASRAASGAKTWRAVEGRADIGERVSLDDLLAHVIDAGAGLLDDLCQQAVVGREEGVPVADREQHAAVGADARSTTARCTVPAGK